MAPLEDAFEKLERGKEHAAHLFAHLKLTFEKDPFKVAIKAESFKKPPHVTDHRPWEAFTLVCAHVPAIPRTDEILLGEAVQSFRTSLDYLAWAWANESTRLHGIDLSAAEERRIQFPMAQSAKHFRSQINSCLPRLSATRRRFVEQFQPYKRSQFGIAMRYLQTLSNFDKHRLIVPALMSPQLGDIQFKWNKSLSLVREIHHLSTKQPIINGTKIMTVVLAGSVPPDHPRVHVDTKITMIPMFPKAILQVKKLQEVVLVEDALNRISSVCTQILMQAKALK